MNLWPAEHFFPHFLTGLLCDHGQRFICTEVPSYKIHILVVEKYQIQNF